LVARKLVGSTNSINSGILRSEFGTIVTVLCDSGQKYQSTLFNRGWLASNHLDPDLPLKSVLGR